MKAHWTSFLRGQPKRRGRMNQTEADYAAILTIRQHAGEVLWFAYEAITLRLADNTRYTPDFIVELADGTLEIHEVKGFWKEAAKLRLKVAAETFPFRFVSIRLRPKKEGGGWEFTNFTKE